MTRVCRHRWLRLVAVVLPLLGLPTAATATTVAVAAAAAVTVPGAALAEDGSDDGSCLLQRAPAERRAPPEALRAAARGILDELRHMPADKLAADPAAAAAHEAMFQIDESADPPSPACNAIGGRVWMSRKGVDYLIDKFMPEVRKLISTMDLASKEGSMYGFTYRVRDIVIDDFFMAQPSVDFVKGKGLNLIVPNISVAVKMRYKVEGSDWWNPLYSSGHVGAIVATTTDTEGLMRVGVSPQGNPHLNMSLSSFSVGLHTLKLSGTVFSGLTSVITDVFKEYIEDVLSSTIAGLVEWFVNDELNSYMDELDLLLALPLPEEYNIAVADMRLCAVHTSPASIIVDIGGAIIDPKKPFLVYPEKPIELPRAPHMTEEEFTNKMVVMMWTKWMINSGFWLFKKSGKLRADILQKDLPSNSPIILNANTLKPLISPNPDARWWRASNPAGNQSQFEVVVEAHDVPEVMFRKGKIDITADVGISFRFIGVSNPDVYATKIRSPLSASVGLTIVQGSHTTAKPSRNGTRALLFAPGDVESSPQEPQSEPQFVHGDVAYVSSLPISVEGATSSTNLWALSGWVTLLSSTVLIPMANDLISKIEIPSAMGISLVNSSLNITDTLTFATDLHVDANEVMQIAYYGTGDEGQADTWDDWGES